MSRTSKIIIVVVLVLIIGGGIFALADRKNTSSMSTSMNMSQSDKSASTSTNTTNTAVATSAVAIQNFAFSPATIKVKVGDTVTWTNKDSAEHSIVADTASADAPNGPLFGQGKTYSFTFKTPGTYAYHCGVHASMTGTIVVSQ